MPGTEPLTGARIPTQSDGPLGGLQISNGITDLAPNTIPNFATASDRDTAFAAWVAAKAGRTMRAGLYCTVAGRLQTRVGSAWVDAGIGVAAQGRVPFTTTGKVVNTTALTGVITVPAVAVPARVVFTALGRSGFAAGARSVAWDWDNVPGSATNVDNDYDSTQVDVAASQWTTVVASLTMDLPASAAAAARLLLRSSGDAYNRGAVIWHRTPL